MAKRPIVGDNAKSPLVGLATPFASAMRLTACKACALATIAKPPPGAISIEEGASASEAQFVTAPAVVTRHSALLA